MAPIDKSLMHGSQLVMRCSLQMVYQWTEELSIHTNGANRKASLTNGDFFTNGTIGDRFLTIGICLCILDMCGEEAALRKSLFCLPFRVSLVSLMIFWGMFFTSCSPYSKIELDISTATLPRDLNTTDYLLSLQKNWVN